MKGDRAMKNVKRLVSLLFAILICLSASVVASAAGDANTVDGSILEFEPLMGDVNIDGFLNLKDLVRYKKYSVGYAGAEIDFEVADFDGDEDYNAADILSLQLAIIDRLFA